MTASAKLYLFPWFALLALSCRPAESLAPDPLPVYSVILKRIVELEVAMPPDCAQPVNIFVETNGVELPRDWLAMERRPCREFHPASEFTPGAGVYVRLGEVEWSGVESARVNEFISFTSSGDSSKTYVLERERGTWKIVRIDVHTMA